MSEILSEFWANVLYRRLVLSILVIVVGAIVRRILLWFALTRIPEDSPYVYSVRKLTGYIVSLVTAFLLFSIWVQQVGDLSVALGILGAGLAFALQEVIGSIAGWVTIISGRPFSVGDRIETGGIKGDVVDVGVLRTTLMEVGNWLKGDHNTGRIVTVSNAYIFKEPLFNYSGRLAYIYDEIIVPITYESDWKRAIEIMHAAASNNAHYQELLPKATESRRRARREFAVKITNLEARVFVGLTDNWIELGLVYPVDTDLRRVFRNEISEEILTRFAEESIVIASETVSIVRFPSSQPAPSS